MARWHFMAMTGLTLTALACIVPSFPRDRLHILTALALARVHPGELDGACRAATEAGCCCDGSTPSTRAPG